ncbi:MAG: hypothetical protein CL773_02325 [Chloroflexi bacterium]|nr:hypothetical protein [Chloroflexota bacterium]
MYTWINHNSLYILIFLFPILFSSLLFFYVTKNKLIIIVSFILITLLFVSVKIFFQPKSNNDLTQVELIEIIDNKENVVIEFFSPNCMGCVLSQTAINEFINNYSNEFKVIKLNVSDSRYSNIISENMITVTPTFIYYKKGKIYEKYVGMLNDSEKLYQKFNR